MIWQTVDAGSNHARLTEDMAIRFEKAFGLKADMLCRIRQHINLQAHGAMGSSRLV